MCAESGVIRQEQRWLFTISSFAAFCETPKDISLFLFKLGFLLSLSDACHKYYLVCLWVIGYGLPLAQMKIENEPEHGVWACSQLISSVPSGDRMHTDHLQALDFWGRRVVMGDLCFCPLGTQNFLWLPRAT